eukprot:GHVR01168589.1.p1 GENE.GHVR01168589.1~~GHVR01168589.1.p1  ORF type:complete len:155 (+),score=16.06 GHVR01168589.1:625-1089(+)
MLDFKPITDKLTRELIESFQSKGHSMNGKFETSVRNIVVHLTDQIIIEGYYADYGDYLNKGVEARSIPYNPSVRTGAGKSRYIEGLIRYVEFRLHKSGREGVGIAFAIANRQKQKGMSLRRTKRGSFFVDEFLKKSKYQARVRQNVSKRIKYNN